MAPKGSKGSKGKGSESSKGKRVEDTHLMDKRKNSQLLLEETIKEVNSKNDQLKQALLGFARFDVLENRDRIHFGKWNPRGIQSSEVTRLAESFEVNGLDRFNPTHAMPLSGWWWHTPALAMGECSQDAHLQHPTGLGGQPRRSLGDTQLNSQ
ncbi:hypothetical protein F5141DRAFT_1070346 [Pisolithus sp. B1]|nr:hypothetical protein F5141DRAFT_1070346 [Pisolithus sp. B1]